MLDSAIKDQLKGLFAQLEAHYTFDIFVHPQHESRAELVDLLEEVASCSDKLSCRLQGRTCWQKWLPGRINIPVGCRIVKG